MEIPELGAIIRTNYGTGPYRVIRIYRSEENEYFFVCHDADDPKGRRGESYLNNYRIIDGRLLGRQQRPGTAGYLSNHGGLNGDGYDEIIIEAPAVQPTLFRVWEEVEGIL